jgi:peptide chain release factor 2
LKESTLRSASSLTLCGAIFDAAGKRSQLSKLEHLISDPEFWNQPEKSQKVMQDRKRLEEAVAHDSKIAGINSDLETLFELHREGEDVGAELERELKLFRHQLEELETGMLLSGENASRSAIMAIHPGAGGTESQDWAEMLLRMYLRWVERTGRNATAPALNPRLSRSTAKTLTVFFNLRSASIALSGFRLLTRTLAGIRRSPPYSSIRRWTMM